MKTSAKKRSQQTEQPTPTQAIAALKQLIDTATWPDLDARTTAGATKLAARWSVAHRALACLRRMAKQAKPSALALAATALLSAAAMARVHHGSPALDVHIADKTAPLTAEPACGSRTSATQALAVSGVTIGKMYLPETTRVRASCGVRKDVPSDTVLVDETSRKLRQATRSKYSSDHTWTSTRRIYRTAYTNAAGIAVAVEMRFVNLIESELAEIVKGLDDRYSRNRQAKQDVYTYAIGKRCALETTVVRSETMIQVVNFYYDEMLWEAARKEAQPVATKPGTTAKPERTAKPAPTNLL